MKPHPLEAYPPLSKEEINRIDIQRYNGKIELINSNDKMGKAVKALSREKIVGIDTETKPTFKKGEYYPPCLVQIAASKAAYIFQLKRMDDLAPLAGILEHRSIIKTGIGLRGDFTELEKVFPFTPQNTVDLSLVAQKEGMKRSGVRNLAARFLDIRIPKGASTSNWQRVELTPKQITYAATDAWICRELFLKFQEIGFIKPDGEPRIKPKEEQEEPEA